jgi:hypothetical protein
MAMSSLTYIPSFYVKFFFQPIYADCGGKDLNVIFYQNMPNLHNRYTSAERKNVNISAHLDL